jgi:deazaflavin-dependent oxidoreductase (nitroreductase family)
LGRQRFLALTTVGRKSGSPRVHLLTYVEEGGAWFVVGTNAGEPTHPAWWLNLKDHPDATVMIGGRTTNVEAEEVEGETRRRIWEGFVEVDEAYAVYAARTERRIPVVALRPEPPATEI